jgi:hypothetical protein
MRSIDVSKVHVVAGEDIELHKHYLHECNQS